MWAIQAATFVRRVEATQHRRSTKSSLLYASILDTLRDLMHGAALEIFSKSPLMSVLWPPNPLAESTP